jgi:methyl-accepting chemotaxis protein
MEVTRIQSALSQLSNEAIQAAVVRVDEGGFDKNRGIVPLDRSVEDLQIARDLLLVFASEGRAERVPVLIRQAVGEPLEVIASCITDLSNGADRVPDFVQAVDRLRAAIWQYHLDQPGSDYLKLQDRLGELGGLIAEAKSLRKEVDARLQQLRDLETVRQNSDQAFQQTAGFATQAQEGFTLVQDRLQQIESLLTTSKNYEGQISTVSAAVGTIRDTVITMSEDLTSIYDEGHKFKETISETSRRAESTIAEPSSSPMGRRPMNS